jgi:tetratricopeptide (TPR) repeat protein
MPVDRIKMLEQFLKDDPTDPFSLYALALEYQKENVNKSAELFEELLHKHPDYLPTYYMAGSFYIEQANADHALQILREGLELARRQGDTSAARELQAAIQNLED